MSDFILAQEVLQDPDADILTKRYCTRDPHTEILYKRSYRILVQTSWQRDLAQGIRIQRSCTSSLTEEILTQKPCTRDPHTEILHKRSCRILMQTSWQRDLAQEILIQRSCTSDLLRRSWHGHLAQEILIHRSCTSAPTGFCWRDLKHLVQEILIQRFCTRSPTGSWRRHPDREILQKRSAYRDLAQVVIQDPDAVILTQRYAQEIRIQRSCTSNPT